MPLPRLIEINGKLYAWREVTATAPAQLAGAILGARTAAGISQIELAARIKTSQGNIVRLEKGRSVLTTRTLQRIAKATGHELTITSSRKG
jgi:transcriptional regulator with XRE-family HTH domain